MNNYRPEQLYGRLRRIMEFSLVQILLVTLLAQFTLAGKTGGQNLMEKKISLIVKEEQLKTVLGKIERATGAKFIYSPEQVGAHRRVSVKAAELSLKALLDQLLPPLLIHYQVVSGRIVLKPNQSEPKGESDNVGLRILSIVTGVVQDESGELLPGVNVVMKGNASVGTTTDTDGKFSIDVPRDAVLKFSFIGYLADSVKVGNQTFLKVVLKKDVRQLNELVVVGYGVQNKSDVTGAISSVGEKDFNRGTMISPEQLIQGKMSGVNVTASSGEPGAALAITIRGPGSLRSGNTPLFVVDGVPLDNSARPPSTPDVGFGTSVPSNPLNFLNPSDIVSMDVLKDASATAIYGSRGANGVVIITTKKGSAKLPGMEYSAYAGVSEITRKLDLLNASEFTKYMDQNNRPENVYDRNVQTDWQDQIFRKASMQSHQLSFNGGSDRSTYYISLGLMNQQGLIKFSDLKRYSARFNFTQKMLKDRLSVAVNLTASQVRNSGTPRSDVAEASAGNLISQMANANPTYPTHDENGNLFRFPNGKNPLAMLDIYKDFTRTNRVLGNIEGTLRILKGLEYKLNFAIDNSTSGRDTQVDPSSLPNMSYPEGRVVFSSTEYTNRLIDNYLKYNLTFDRQEVVVLAGHSYQRFFRRSNSSSINNFSTDQIDPIYNPGIGTSLNISQNLPTGSAGIDELQSFFGRVNYTLANKYLLTATVRADGSSKFGANNKYGYFPSLSAAWKMSEEGFLKGVSVLDELKLRAGWGQTGNQEIPGKITLPLLLSSVGNGQGYPLAPGGVNSGYIYSRTANPDIKWEVVTQSNIGVDFALFRGAFSGSIDYYQKKTNDILLNLTVTDPISPTSTRWTNVDMDIINKGLELAVEFTKLNLKSFRWTIGANMTFINNVVKRAPFSLISSGRLKGPGMSGVTANGYMNNQAIGTFYLYDFVGLNEKGENRFRDVNGDGVINDSDRIAAGSAVPDKMFNFHGRIGYKGFDLSVNFNGVSGNKIYNNTANSYFNLPSLARGLNVTRDVLELPDESPLNSSTYSTRYLESGTYLRLNNATLSYRFKTSGIDWLRNLSLYITGQNLLTFTKYKGFDPEVDVSANVGDVLSYGIDFTNYPRARNYLLGLNLSF